jgi:flagellar motor switch/type III secretory pathway protein FliN
MEDENPATPADVQAANVPPQEDPWAAVSGLPCQLSVGLAVPGFRVADLLSLDVETVIDSGCNSTGAVPVWVNGARIGLAEFDVLGARLAIRVKELG